MCVQSTHNEYRKSRQKSQPFRQRNVKKKRPRLRALNLVTSQEKGCSECAGATRRNDATSTARSCQQAKNRLKHDRTMIEAERCQHATGRYSVATDSTCCGSGPVCAATLIALPLIVKTWRKPQKQPNSAFWCSGSSAGILCTAPQFRQANCVLTLAGFDAARLRVAMWIPRRK